MKARAEETPERLRGGFYTPDALVDLCLERVHALSRLDRPLRVLEPSAGDGAFIRGLARSARREIDHLTAVEPFEIEAEKSRRQVQDSGIRGSVVVASALEWSADAAELFDVAVGNPPFVRYQFISKADQASAQRLAARMGVGFAGVANLWIPVFLGALSRLATGGVFSFVVPTECMTGVSAGLVRRWVLEHFEQVRFDHFPPRSFPGVLQEVALLSGRRASAAQRESELSIVEHNGYGDRRRTTHRVQVNASSWTKYLLNSEALNALDTISRSPLVKPFHEVATFEVSIVTGANDFFSVDDSTVRNYSLSRWARPLLPRIRHGKGLVLTDADMLTARRGGAKTNLLDFSAEADDPMLSAGPSEYLAEGASRGLPARYKCRIRKPWYRVPGIKGGSLLLSKRSHDFPRVVVNAANVYTTDTIYRGQTASQLSPRDIAASFHNSITLLSAELEGRSFGGGVLELVPSEIARLAFPAVVGAELHLEDLDRVARTQSPDSLVRATDRVIARALGVDAAIIGALDVARREVRDRRFARNRPERSVVRDRVCAGPSLEAA